MHGSNEANILILILTFSLSHEPPGCMTSSRTKIIIFSFFFQRIPHRFDRFGIFRAFFVNVPCISQQHISPNPQSRHTLYFSFSRIISSVGLFSFQFACDRSSTKRISTIKYRFDGGRVGYFFSPHVSVFRPFRF